jgi:hypothetical protein
MKLVAAVDYQGKQEVQTYHEGMMELRGFAWLRWQHKKGWLIQVPYVGACMVSMKIQVTSCSAQGTSANDSLEASKGQLCSDISESADD